MAQINSKLMSNHSSTILAIAPGTRELGFAVLCGKNLLYYGVKTVTDRKNPANVLEKVSGFTRSLIKKYRPTDLAIEKTFLTHKNWALLAVIAEQVKAVARDAQLPVYEYAPRAIRERLCESGKTTKREAAKVLSERFPELKRYFLRADKWERDYYANLFDAVAAAVMCLNDLENDENSKQ
jgi:Holliday junction resolvasome RuvABC endonuclease subunit